MAIRARPRRLLAPPGGGRAPPPREAARDAPEQQGDEHDGEGDPRDDHELGALDGRDAGLGAAVVDLGDAPLRHGRRDRAADGQRQDRGRRERGVDQDCPSADHVPAQRQDHDAGEERQAREGAAQHVEDEGGEQEAVDVVDRLLDRVRDRDVGGVDVERALVDLPLENFGEIEMD